MISLTRNDYEPDICYFNAAKAADFMDDQRRFPAPDLAVEFLSKKTASRDRGIKYEDYAAHGVQEYWIIDPVRKTVEQYVLTDSAYELTMKASEGILRSVAVEGFAIPIAAIFDKQENLRVLNDMMHLGED